MEPALKQRLIGAVVISALAIYFLPKFIVGHDKDSPAADVSLQVPGAPDRNFETRELPLTAPGTAPPGGVVGMNTNAPPLPTPAVPAPAVANSTASPIDPNAPVAPAPADVNGTPASIVLPTIPAASTPVAATPGPSAAAPTPPNATAPASPGALIPATHAGSNYAVNAGIYSNAANAQSLVSSLKAAQLPAYSETVTANGKSSTRVRIGPFAQRADAEAARLHAQQVRTDMATSVTVLEAATETPAVASNSAAGKPTVTSVAIKPALAKPVASNPSPASTPAAPAAPTTVKPAIATPPSPAATSHGYVVQVGALRTEEEALTLRNRLRAAGFTAFSEQLKTDNGILYRVRVGPTADRAAADQLRTSLSQKMALSGVVMAYP